jgi:hypothetical protein
MDKTYLVTWQSPNHSGEVEVVTDDFRNIGLEALRAVAPPVECPTVITKIELADPARYLGKQEVKRFRDVLPGQKLSFLPVEQNGMVYTKTEPYAIPRGIDKGRISEMTFIDPAMGKNRRRAFCHDQDHVVYIVEPQEVPA